MKARFGLCGALVMVAALPLGAGERIAMRVSPAVSFAPANLIVKLTVDGDSGNRAMEIVAESPEFYRSSTIQLDGDHAPRTTVFEFRSLPGGTYSVSATLYGADGERRAASHSQVNVIENGSAGH